MRSVPTDTDLVRDASSVAVEMTDELVQRFVALTGDCSSLHISDEFARRSAYRRPVAHGMLPVSFLALSKPFQMERFRCVPVALSARFLVPVFAGDRLRLNTTPVRISPGAGEAEFDFEVEQVLTGQVATRGSAAVVYEPTEAIGSSNVAGRGPMVAEVFDVRQALLEEIVPGAIDETPFSISDVTIGDFSSMLASGAGSRAAIEKVPTHCHVPNLLAVLLFSTSVGVRMPGALATFLEFNARIEQRIASGKPYRLVGKVTHRSASTRIVKKEMLVLPAVEADAMVRGKISALVAEPASAMPSIDELRASCADWGLRDKVVVITGASRGLGETTAKLFALHGAKVVVNYHRGAADARRVVNEIQAAGGTALAVQADVSDAEAVKTLMRRATAQYGAIDILVNNAARDARPIPFLKLTWDEIQRDLDVIAKGAFHCCQEVVPLMLEQGGGKIINVSTVFTDNPPFDQMKYVIAKSALVGLTRSLSIELAARNVQVNLVVPNFVETDFVAHVPEGFRKKLAETTPMRRHASPVDVARAVVFLASAHSSFTTGQKLMVTGGGAPYV
jgi:3-oxoacyl-[acyl-carrier protein] reductase